MTQRASCDNTPMGRVGYKSNNNNNNSNNQIAPFSREAEGISIAMSEKKKCLHALQKNYTGEKQWTAQNS